MRKTFKHLDLYTRDRLEALWKKGHTQVEIAGILEVHKSTVSREIQEKKKQNGIYKANVAQHKARVLRSNSKYQGMKIEEHPKLRRYIVSQLKQYQSPDGIAGRLRREGIVPRVSTDAIYRWLRSPLGQKYCKYLCTKRYNKKPHTESEGKHGLVNMTSIHKLSEYLEFVTEGDTFLSPKRTSKSSAVLIVWRDSKLLKGDLVPSLKPKHTTKVMQKIHKQYRSNALILDQGFENREHLTFGVPTFFCDKASPRQKPLIESSIGLCRRWFWPKGTNLGKLTKTEFQEKLEVLNSKYRKTLRYRSANEVAQECGILGEY